MGCVGDKAGSACVPFFEMCRESWDVPHPWLSLRRSQTDVDGTLMSESEPAEGSGDPAPTSKAPQASTEDLAGRPLFKSVVTVGSYR